MLSKWLLVLLSPCLWDFTRATAEQNGGTDLDWASKIEATDAAKIRPDQFSMKSDISARSVDDLDDDQQTDSAIISVNYRDKSGNLKTIKGNANRLLLKRRKPQQTSQLKKNRGNEHITRHHVAHNLTFNHTQQLFTTNSSLKRPV